MKLGFAIICDNAFTDGDGRLNIVQTFDTLRASSFPAIHPRLTVVTNFELEKEDSKSKEYTQKTVIKQRDTGKEIASAQGATKPSGEETRSIQFISYFIGLPLDLLPGKKDGFYDVEIDIENLHLTTFFKVEKA